MFKKQIPDIDPFDVFQKLPATAKAPFFSWSASPNGWNRIITFDPVDQLILYANDSLDALDRFCDRHAGKFLAGYLSFDLGYKLLEINRNRVDGVSVPLVHFSAYENYIQFEKSHATCFYTDPGFLDTFSRILSLENKYFKKNSTCHFSATLDQSTYHQNFEKIIDYIKAGDIYQINYTHLMRAETNLEGKRLFIDYTKTNPVDYAVYWEAGDLNIISLSPESFVQIKNGTIITKPIKGTRPRGDSLLEDDRLQNELFESSKEQAELFMITDLLRNDVGKVSQVGTVKVLHQKKLQKLASVFHTFAEIEGQKNPWISNIEALISMFPGGSITGCPKKRAMEIIDEIEDQPRGIYTGSIGYILPNRDLEFNIAIRTVAQKGRNLSLGVGGGITIKSEVNDEYQETFSKARSFFNSQA